MENLLLWKSPGCFCTVSGSACSAGSLCSRGTLSVWVPAKLLPPASSSGPACPPLPLSEAPASFLRCHLPFSIEEPVIDLGPFLSCCTQIPSSAQTDSPATSSPGGMAPSLFLGLLMEVLPHTCPPPNKSQYPSLGKCHVEDADSSLCSLPVQPCCEHPEGRPSLVHQVPSSGPGTGQVSVKYRLHSQSCRVACKPERMPCIFLLSRRTNPMMSWSQQINAVGSRNKAQNVPGSFSAAAGRLPLSRKAGQWGPPWEPGQQAPLPTPFPQALCPHSDAKPDHEVVCWAGSRLPQHRT